MMGVAGVLGAAYYVQSMVLPENTLFEGIVLTHSVKGLTFLHRLRTYSMVTAKPFLVSNFRCCIQTNVGYTSSCYLYL
jgi:hypothetical protein